MNFIPAFKFVGCDYCASPSPNIIVIFPAYIPSRRLLGTVLTVYIPTVLLIIISHMTNYFKPFFFEAVVSVNLTVMLVTYKTVNMDIVSLHFRS